MSDDSIDFENMISPTCSKHGIKYEYKYDKEENYIKYCPECDKEDKQMKKICGIYYGK